MIILDGGLGRQLEAMGAPFRQPEWSAAALIEGPHFVRAAHDAFIAAGADVISTNSYAVVPHHIGEETYAERADELLTIAAREAREAASAAERHVRVAASVPPMFGSYLPGALFFAWPADDETVRRQLAPVADIFCGETLGSIAEVTAFLMFLVMSQPVWVSVTLEDTD